MSKLFSRQSKHFKIWNISFLVFIGFLLLQNNVHAQRMDTLISDYAAKYPQERIHLHFDKPAYSPKDDIWFKAYVLLDLTPDNASKTLYVDFSDEKGKVLAHQAYPIANGVSRGQFTVPDSLQGNLVHVHAYTKWMLNFDTAFLYNKNINIIQSRLKYIKGKPPVPVPSLYLFPEGGVALTGVRTRIAFMAEDQFGQPVNITGTITDNTGSKVVDLQVQHDGMGSFYLQPETGKSYIANWKDEKGGAHTTPLSDIKNTGVTLGIQSGSSQKMFIIQRTDNVPEEDKSLHIIATMYQQPVYMANVTMTDKNIVSGAINTAGFPSGIMQVTVFDKDWNPLTERICCVKGNDNPQNTEVGFSKLSFEKRGVNELVINATGNTPANYSVAVTDINVGADSSNNILSDFLLSSQIKGRVFHPYYYFTDTSAKAQQDLDLVMLTHGWRKFDWKSIETQQNRDIKYPMDTSYLSLSGKVYGATPAQIASSGGIFTILQPVKDTTRSSLLLPLNSDGTFSDPNAVFFDSLNVYYKFVGKRDYLRNAEISFMPNRLVSPLHLFMNPNDIIRARQYDTTGLAGGQMLYDKYWKLGHFDEINPLQTVTVTANVKSPAEKLDDKYTSGLFKSGDAQIFDVMNDIAAQGSLNVFSYLQGRVAGLQITNPMANPPTLSWRGSSPALFLDEIPQQDASMIENLNMSDIAMIKVFRPPFIGAFGGGGGGAIAIYTKKGGDVERTGNSSIPHKTIEGYTIIREFYMPNYQSLATDASKPDVRTTIYWNPLISTTPKDPEVKLQFFNNDYSKAFRIILEGMDNNGQLTHIEKIIQ